MKRWMFRALFWFLVISSGAGELPKIGFIDFYGLQTVKREELLKQLEVKKGDPIPVDFGNRAVTRREISKLLDSPEGGPVPLNQRDIERKLKSVKGVADARLQGVCCESDGTETLFVGIQERGGAAFEYRKEPTGGVALPDSIVETYDRYLDAVVDAVQTGAAQEDDSQGHALFSTDALKSIQTAFISFANQNSNLLRRVLLESQNAKHRAAAATVVGYTNDKNLALGS